MTRVRAARSAPVSRQSKRIRSTWTRRRTAAARWGKTVATRRQTRTLTSTNNSKTPRRVRLSGVRESTMKEILKWSTFSYTIPSHQAALQKITCAICSRNSSSSPSRDPPAVLSNRVVHLQPGIQNLKVTPTCSDYRCSSSSTITSSRMGWTSNSFSLPNARRKRVNRWLL